MDLKSAVHDHTRALVDYRETDDGAITLCLDKKLPNTIARAEPAFVESLLSDAKARGHAVPTGIDAFDIACHTGGPRVLQVCAGDKYTVVLAEDGRAYGCGADGRGELGEHWGEGHAPYGPEVRPLSGFAGIVQPVVVRACK